MYRRILALVAGAGMLVTCGGKNPGPGPTPIIDPPAVVCPADLSITGIIGSSQAVTFATPIPTAGTQPVTVTCSPTSGSAFPLGTSAVRCTASDAAARQASCNFNVTVKGLTLGVTKYLTFGDSVTEGQNGQSIGALQFVDVPNAYPTRLQSLLEATYPGQGITVLNGGFGGEPIEKAVERLPAVMAAERPGAVLLIDGYNNLLADCDVRVGVTPKCKETIDFVAGKLRECVRAARSGPNPATYVFVGTLTPPGPFVPTPGYTDRRIAPGAITQINARIKSQIPGEGATVVDLYTLFLGHEAEFTGPDGLHLAPPGNQAIADAFFAAIKTAIPQTPAFGLTR
jgi:lysophospholipase L1-like esterase